MVTLCGNCGGSQSARAGGTIQAASAVSTRMMPVTACRNWPRRWMCKGMWSPAPKVFAIAATGRGASSMLRRYSGMLSVMAQICDENRPNIAKRQG